jgi:hypothetical protein
MVTQAVCLDVFAGLFVPYFVSSAKEIGSIIAKTLKAKSEHFWFCSWILRF